MHHFDNLWKALQNAKREDLNITKIKQAYLFSNDAHKGQKRKSGEDYIIHPVAVAEILFEIGADEDSIIAALLHDVVEDTSRKNQDIQKIFGKNVSRLIDGMTKFSKGKFREAESMNRKIESLRKWFVIMEKDIRVAIIKIADRFHNMRTLDGHNNPQKQKKIAQETLDVYVKIADKLGIYVIKKKLQRLCLKHLDPKSFKILKKIQKQNYQDSTAIITKIEKELQETKLSQKIENIVAEEIGVWRIYQEGMHKKTYTRGILPLEIVITTKTIADCYSVLYLIHSLWKSDRGSLNDYINAPPPNGYEGIHTKVFYNGNSVLFRIHTTEMHQKNQYGVCNFCFSKKKGYHGMYRWLEHLSHVTGAEKRDSNAFLQQLQNDIFGGTIVVHTKNEENLTLPQNATTLDVAFFLHKEKALFLKEIFVNGNVTAFYKPLQSKDVIHFTFDKKKQVTYEWLNYVNLAFAKEIIRTSLKKVHKDEKIAIGKKLLDQKLLDEGKGFLDEVGENQIKALLEKYKIASLDKVCEKIAEGKINPDKIVDEFYSKKSNNILPKMTLECQGKLSIIQDFFERIPISLKKKMRYSVKGHTENTKATFAFRNIKKSRWNYVFGLAKKYDFKYNLINNAEKRSMLFLMGSIIILWALDPFFAGQLLNTTSITPLALTAIRFLAGSVFLMLIMACVLLFKKKQNTISKVFNFNKESFLISIFLFFTAFFTYLSLENTLASDYLLFLRIYVAFVVSALIFRKKPAIWKRMIFYNILIFAGIILVFFSNHEWMLRDKIFTLLAVLFFGLYSFLNGHFRRKKLLTVSLDFFSLFGFHLVSSFCCAFFCLFLIPFVKWSSILPIEYLYSIIFVILFTILPYVLFLKMVRKKYNFELLTLNFGLEYFIVIIAEIILLNIYPSFSKILFIILIFTGIFLLGKIAKTLDSSCPVA